MSDYVLKVEEVSKRYRLGVTGTSTVSQDFNRFVRRLQGKADDSLKIDQEGSYGAENWALQDISFELKQGTVLGVIGKNGAGKSTLLKLLSKVTLPTKGTIRYKGRIASLLEVGTGFHAELTGRENIFLNGAILGMNKIEIQRQLDAIIDFSGVEKYIDTPVKRYSSGMYVRLAFAVAAHLEPEILIVDEVLAVGDAAFQKKCLAKMEGITGEGRTILFVSHNMNSITSLCNKAIWLEKGKMVDQGDTSAIVSKYLNEGLKISGQRKYEDQRPGSNTVELIESSVKDISGQVVSMLDIKESFFVEMEYQVKEDVPYELVPNIHFFNEEGYNIFDSLENENALNNRGRLSPGRYKSRVLVPGNFASEGTLIIGIALSSFDPSRVHFYEREAIAVQITDDLDSAGSRGIYTGPMLGFVRPKFKWETEKF